LERIRAPGYTEIASTLLNINYVLIGVIEKTIISTLSRSKGRGGTVKDYTVMATKNKWEFTYFCGDGTQTSNIERMLFLPEFCLHKMNETGIYSWVGIVRDTSIRKPSVGVFLSGEKQ
jgi:hypothetical protein